MKKRVPGKAKGLIKMRSNFDDSVEGFKAQVYHPRR